MNPNAQVTMLLTLHLGKLDMLEFKPLSTKEWTTLAFWLKEKKLEPSCLLSSEFRMSGCIDSSITLPRLKGLLERSVRLATYIEKWERAGLWILTRSDLDYPNRLRDMLK